MRVQPHLTTSFAGLQADNAILDVMRLFPAGWVVYILECEDGSLYTGTSNDLAKRLRTHMSGHGAKYTRSHLPSKLVYVEPCHSQSQALKREMSIKQLSKEQKQKLVRQFTQLSGG